MKTVLITGGTGLVGTSLSATLLTKGYKVIILSRSLNNRPAHTNLSYAFWDIKTQKIHADEILQADCIVHLAGAAVVANKWTKVYKNEIVDSRIQSSKLIINLLKNNINKVKTVISASAIGWYGTNKEAAIPFIETDEADDSFLGTTCKSWEASIDAITNLGIRLVKLRIGIVLSNNGGALAKFKKTIKLGAATILGNGKQVISWIHINDLCRMIIYTLENESNSGVYNAVAPYPVSNKKLTITLAKAMNGKFYIPMYLPAYVLKILMGQRSIELLKSSTVSCKKIMDAGFKFNYENIGQAFTNLIKK